MKTTLPNWSDILSFEKKKSGKTVEFIIKKALHQGATDLHIETRNNCLCLFFRINGYLQRKAEFSQHASQIIIDEFKRFGGLQVERKNIIQEGHINKPFNKNTNLRIYSIPFTPWESIIIRFHHANSPQKPTAFNETKQNIPNIKKKIFIWQMGKVGSSTIFNSLKPITDKASWDTHEFVTPDHWMVHNNVLHTHSIQTLYNFLHQSEEEFVVISLVRDLLARNISSIFQSMNREAAWNSFFIAKKEEFEKYSYPRQQKEIAHKLKALNLDNHLLNWYTNLFKSHFYYPDIEQNHIDIYETPFNQKRGYQVYGSKNKRVKMIILRLENLNNLESELGAFLGVNNFHLLKDNLSQNKWYKNIYDRFSRSYTPSEEEIDKIYRSQFMQYFYSEKQIEEFIQRWTTC